MSYLKLCPILVLLVSVSPLILFLCPPSLSSLYTIRITFSCDTMILIFLILTFQTHLYLFSSARLLPDYSQIISSLTLYSFFGQYLSVLGFPGELSNCIYCYIHYICLSETEGDSETTAMDK